MPVRVRLMTPSRVSFESPAADSKSSRLRIVEASSTK